MSTHPIQPASEPPPPLVPREWRLRLDPLLLLATLGLVAASLIAIVTLMTEPRGRVGFAASARSVSAVPSVMSGALRVIRANRLLVALVAAELFWGAGMIAFETFFPPRLAW